MCREPGMRIVRVETACLGMASAMMLGWQE